MKTLALLVVLLLPGCATIKGVEISDDERKACEEQGRTVWTKAELEELVRLAIMRGVEAARRQRGNI